MCKIHGIHYSINTLNNSVNKITECIVIFKKIEKCNCMRFFFVGYIPFHFILQVFYLFPLFSGNLGSDCSSYLSLHTCYFWENSKGENIC